MKPRPRIRRMVKWGGLVVTVLLLVVWIGSAWYGLGWDTPWSWDVGVNAGNVYVARWDAAQFGAHPPGGFRLIHNQPSLLLGWSLKPGDPYDLGASVPIWMLAIVSGSVSFVVWRLDPLTQGTWRNLCPKCNYDRAGIAGDARCPECGASGEVQGSGP